MHHKFEGQCECSECKEFDGLFGKINYHKAKVQNEKIKADALIDFVETVEGAIENGFISDRECDEMKISDFLNLARKHADKILKESE